MRHLEMMSRKGIIQENTRDNQILQVLKKEMKV